MAEIDGDELAGAGTSPLTTKLLLEITWSAWARIDWSRNAGGSLTIAARIGPKASSMFELGHRRGPGRRPGPVCGRKRKGCFECRGWPVLLSLLECLAAQPATANNTTAQSPGSAIAPFAMLGRPCASLRPHTPGLGAICARVSRHQQKRTSRLQRMKRLFWADRENTELAIVFLHRQRTGRNQRIEI